MLFPQPVPGQIENGFQNQIRQRGQVVAQRFELHRAFKVADQQLKDLCVLKVTQMVHLPPGHVTFRFVDVIELIDQFIPECAPVG